MSSNEPRIQSELKRLIQEDRVSRDVYLNPSIFDLEMERIFHRAWLYLAHESQIPRKGDYVTAWMGRQPVIVVRHKDRRIYVVHNRCPHRGVMLITDDAGNTGDTIRCGYHGWTFRTNGDLLLAPMPDAYRGRYDLSDPFFCLARVPRVDQYRGFVFASLSPQSDSSIPDLVTFLGDTRKCIDRIVDRAPDGEVDVSRGVHKYIIRANWKTQIENLNDCYHPPFAHASSTDNRQRQFRRRYGDETGLPLDTSDGSKWDSVAAVPLDWGSSYSGPLPFDHDSRAGQIYDAHWASLLRVHSEARVKEIMTELFHNVIIYPSVVMQLASSHVRTIRPIAPDRTEINVRVIWLKGAPDAMNKQLVRYLNTTQSAGALIQADDVEMFRRIQGGLPSTGHEYVWFNRHMDDDAAGRGGGTSEVIMRNQYRRGYLRYMTNRDQ